MEETKTVLIVEDEEIVRRAAVCMLHQVNGIKVLQASGAAEAVEIVAVNPGISLLILDYQLPDGNGPQLAKTLGLQVPVIIMTAYWVEDPEISRRTNGYPIIQKPFTPHQLQKEVSLLL